MSATAAYPADVHAARACETSAYATAAINANTMMNVAKNCTTGGVCGPKMLSITARPPR
jgi:hypothetical protein